MLDPVIVVEHTVSGDSHFVFSQAIHVLAFHHPPQKEVDKCLGIVASGLHFLCQRPLFHLMAVRQHPLRVQHRHPVKSVLIHIFADLHGSSGVPGLYDDGKLIRAHIALHSIPPALVPDLQKICQDLHVDAFPRLLIKAVLQNGSGLLQFFGICLAAGFQFGQFLLGLTQLFPQFSQLAQSVLPLFFHVFPDFLQVSFQPF